MWHERRVSSRGTDKKISVISPSRVAPVRAPLVRGADVRCNCLPFAIARSDMRVAALRLALLALCAAADGLQAGFTPLPATAASVAARAPVVLAQESSPFAKLANVPAPALVASFTGAGLVVVVRGLVEHTACASLLPRSSYSAAGGTGVFNSRPTGRRTLCGRRDRPPKAGPGLAGRGMSLPRAQRPELHRAQCAVQYLKNCLIYEPNGLSRKCSGRARDVARGAWRGAAARARGRLAPTAVRPARLS